MLSAECLTLLHARHQMPLPEPAGVPPLMPVAAGGLSERPRCRIFPVGRLWVLQIEMPARWLLGEGLVEPLPRIMFPTLAAAVNHAIVHGYDYRIITPGPVARIPDRGHRKASSESREFYRPATGRSKTEH